jgi:peptidoglycan hydrolase-like protein with peptidoglycan-binding domain
MQSWKYALTLTVWSLLITAAFAQTPGSAASLDREHIRDAQRTLALLGFDPGPPDGVLGPRTKAAVTRFQQSQGLTSTGALDAKTRSTLAARQRDHVRKVQRALKDSGYDPGPLDGLLGRQTKTALRRYAAAPAPSAPSRGSQLIEQFRQFYGPGQQSP